MSILLLYPFVSIYIRSYPIVYPCISDILSIYILQFYPFLSINILSYPILSHDLFKSAFLSIFILIFSLFYSTVWSMPQRP